MSNHVLRHRHGKVVLAIVYQEPQPGDTRMRTHGGNEHLVKRQANKSTNPMKLGSMVHDRACVLMAILLSKACLRFGNATKNGPGVEKRSETGHVERTIDNAPFHAARPPCTTAVGNIVSVTENSFWAPAVDARMSQHHAMRSECDPLRSPTARFAKRS